MARVYWFAALWGPGLGGLTGLIFRLLLFFSREAHLGLLLIQLEFLSLLILGVALLKPGHQASLLLMGLMRLIVSEASLGLALLLFRRRHTSGEFTSGTYRVLQRGAAS